MVLFLLTTVGIKAQQLAFPDAQGWGRWAVGGRYGTVYHVTNLNDSGSGSLRDAVSQSNRIVVFDVAGVINISSRLTFASNLYIAGQTAPGEGITIYGNGVSFSGADNIICRYMRFRMGIKGDSGKDCAGVAHGTNMIFDHCSFAWGRDETFSINSDGKGALHSITIQNCIVGQGLMTHSAGGLIQADSITLYRNFYCDNSTRNNKIKGRNQYVNNLVYNWCNGAYLMGGESAGQSYCNIVDNMFINGPSGGGNAFTEGNANFHCYVSDNWQDSNKDGQLNPFSITSYSTADIVSSPYKYPTLEAWNGNSLISNLLPEVGASLPYRDYVDYYMIEEVKSFGTKGALIGNEATLPYGTPNTWNVWTGNKRTDTDGDGMPDEWESANGTNPKKNDAMTISANGYANIENYINSITLEDSQPYLRAPICLEMTSATTTTMKITWFDYTYGEDGFIIEAKTEGTDWTEMGRSGADRNSFTLTKLTPGTAYTIRIRAFKGDMFSDYSKEEVFKTRPETVGIIDIDTYQADAVWINADEWNTEDAGWDSPTNKYADGNKVLFSPSNDDTISLNTQVNPDAVVVNSDANLTISGDGDISGQSSMNKAGKGTLTISTSNSYTGATVLHEGILSFNSLKDAGVKSSIGASEEFAQNWIFDGGTYNYTGSSTATNRCAKIMRETEFSISRSNSTVTMNGSFEGNSDFVLNGKGQLTANTTNFFGYTGKTILKGGTLYLPNAEISNNGIGKSSQLVFAGGTLATKGESENYETYSFPIYVQEGTTSQFSPNRNCYIKSKVSGGGTLQINFPYVREYIQGDWNDFTGKVIGNGGLFLMNNNKSITNGVVMLKNGSRLCGWDTNGIYTIGGLSGDSDTYLSGSSKQTNGFTCTWTIGTANTDETFRGSINNWSCSGSGHTGTVNIIKAGTGDWRLAGTNEYSGTTTINGGRLVVNGTNSGTGNIIVNSGGTLAGKGSVASAVNVKKGGTVYAGDTTLINRNTLNIKGKLTVASGGTISIPIYYDGTTAKSNRLVLSSGASLTNAILNLDMQDIYSATDIPEGTIFTLFSITGSITGKFTEIIPATPGEGKIWDTSELTKTGKIKVAADSSAINAITIDNRNQNQSGIFELSGRKLSSDDKEGNMLPKGIYIVNGEKVMKQ